MFLAIVVTQPPDIQRKNFDSGQTILIIVPFGFLFAFIIYILYQAFKDSSDEEQPATRIRTQRNTLNNSISQATRPTISSENETRQSRSRYYEPATNRDYVFVHLLARTQNRPTPSAPAAPLNDRPPSYESYAPPSYESALR